MTNRSSLQHLPPGATVAPVIIATDKTNLTQFSGSKCAYPVYLTLGNLPRAIRRKPSEHACILIAYLSVDKCRRGSFSKDFQRARNHRLFHESMRLILKSLIGPAEHGVEMTGGDGRVRSVHPLLASYVADYPEQCLVSCTKYGTCPKCQAHADQLQDLEASDDRTPIFTIDTMRRAREGKPSLSEFRKRCMENDVTPCAGYKPFWTDFKWASIHASITPDVLHQLYQGVFRHLVGWCKKAITEQDFDERLRALPPAFGVRHFKNGLSGLSQISGSESKAIAKVLMGCLVGLVPKTMLIACRGLLDFIYLAQYKTHDTTTLRYMKEALALFHANRDVFIHTGLRQDFNIPKFHSLLHYVDSIEMFGATDNYNTEMFERLHIDFAKEGWRASNHRDAFPQMMKWIDRQEKVASFGNYLKGRQRLDHPQPPPGLAQTTSKNFVGQPIQIAKRPHAPNRSLAEIESNHKCPSFSHHLKLYYNARTHSKIPERQLHKVVLPFAKLDVYHMFKFTPTSLDDGVGETNDTDSQTVKAVPSIAGKAARFDTVVVLHNEDAEATGLEGVNKIVLSFDNLRLIFMAGTRIARVKVLFRLPNEPEVLAYIEWYTKPNGHPDSHNMYSIKKSPPRTDNHTSASIVPLANIRQTCQLFPLYGEESVDPTWATDNVLDLCQKFFINNWAGLYAYQTVW